MSKNIALLDPGIDPKGTEKVDNLGDIIISRSINRVLSELFPSSKITRIPSHFEISTQDMHKLKKSDYVFVGGTNLLSSNYKQLNRPLGPFGIRDFFRKNTNFILLGVGWGYGYNKRINALSKMVFRNRIFDKNAVHAVRDSYSEDKVRNELGLKVNNINCPTMWDLNGVPMDLNKEQTAVKTCVFTLTDYLKDFEQDNKLIELLLTKFDDLYFFPQGKWDMQYIQLLPAFVANNKRIQIIERSMKAYDDFIENHEFVYVGTRLHGGIRCLQSGKPAYIVSIDNRAKDIASDTNLASGSRDDLQELEKWLAGESKFGDLKLNLVGIDSFLNAYR